MSQAHQKQISMTGSSQDQTRRLVAKKSTSESVRSESKESLYIDAILVAGTMIYRCVSGTFFFIQYKGI
jgi:hypothetical protein